MRLDEIWGQLGTYLLPLLVILLTGKFLRRLLLLPFEYLSRRTATKVDDVLVEEAGRDLGIERTTLESASATKQEE